MYAAMSPVSPAGRMANTRSATDHDPLLGIVSAIKAYAIAEASRRELGGFVTTSSSAPGEIERLRRLGADGEVVTLDPGEQIVRARLADDDGELSEQCSSWRLRGGTSAGRSLTGPDRPDGTRPGRA